MASRPRDRHQLHAPSAAARWPVGPSVPGPTKEGAAGTESSAAACEGAQPAAGPLTPGRFASLLEQHAEPLWALAAGVLGGRDEAEDVVQEAALAALARLGDFRPGTSFAAWMGAFVRNHARNHARKRRRRATYGADPGALETAAGAEDRRSGRRVARPEEQLARGSHGAGADPGRLEPEVFDDDVLAALSTLGAEARAALLLRVVHEQSYRAIGELLGMPEGTAASHVHRARVQLRAVLGREQEYRSDGPERTERERR